MNNTITVVSALAAVALAAAYRFFRPGPTVVEATEFRLVDSDGSMLAVLKKGDKGARLVFRYENGEPAIIMSIDDGPGLSMYNWGQTPIVELGGPESGGLSLRHGSGSGGILLTNEDPSAPKLELTDGKRTLLRIGPGRELAIHDLENTKRFSVGLLWEEMERGRSREWVSLRWFAPRPETVVKEIKTEGK